MITNVQKKHLNKGFSIARQRLLVATRNRECRQLLRSIEA